MGISESVCWVDTDQDWDLSLSMTERYLWAHSVMHHHNELSVTNELATGSCVMERVKRLAGNEIERGIGIPTMESRACNIPIDKGNCSFLKRRMTPGLCIWEMHAAIFIDYS